MTALHLPFLPLIYVKGLLLCCCPGLLWYFCFFYRMKLVLDVFRHYQLSWSGCFLLAVGPCMCSTREQQVVISAATWSVRCVQWRRLSNSGDRCCWMMFFFFFLRGGYRDTCSFSTCQPVWVVECHLFPVCLAHFSALSLQQIDACVPLLSELCCGANFIGGEIENRWSNFKL